MAGIPSFIIQEEFDRYCGYWWSPVNYHGCLFVLYEETDVTFTSKFNFSESANGFELSDTVTYPYAGTDNPKWELKLLKIALKTGNDSIKFLSVSGHQLDQPYRSIFSSSDSEYLARAGWLPCGSA
ncbi:unnamed protein product [Soboliphyme baturini]|uniref:DPPIV_N domain-containing protein n=1 Tax=Soboliphyme baturini TaxID=241478 RepID=A0A183J8Q9_9BILA|nr:unnamed protein product [Soboliphyme baturini]